MHDATFVSMSQCFRGLQSPIDYAIGVNHKGRQTGQLVQTLAVNQLHGVVVHPALIAHGKNRNDIGMVQVGDGGRLACETIDRFLITGRRKPQDFKGHAPMQRKLLGLKHRSHTAAADLSDDLKIA